MRKVSTMMLVAALAVIGLATQGMMAKEKKAKMAASEKELRWHGTITRSDKDGSTLTVRRRGQNVEKIIHYDSMTKWTQGTKTIELSEVKDGADVICLGKTNEKGDFVATRIDLRRP